MATIQTNTIFSAKTGNQRGTQPLSDIDHDKIANAIRYLSYAKLYYPLEYGFFTKSLATRGATESMEDSNYILALYDFESYFSEFLRKHPEVEQDVNLLSPKEMVDRVNEELVEGAHTRRDAIRKTSQRIVNKTIEQQGLKLNKSEKEEVEKAVGAAMQTSIDGASTTKEFLRSVEERVAPVMLTQIPTVDKSAVTHLVGTVLREDPKELQRVFLSDEKSQKEILERTVFSQLPNKRALHAAINELPMNPDETKEQFFNRAESVARTAMVISSDLSQTPAARIEPGGLISAILEAGGNKDALRAFEKLTEQARNITSLAVVSNSWAAAVEAVRQRSGGAVTGALEEIIKQGNAQWGARSGEPLGRAGSAVAGVLGEILTPAFINYVDAQFLLQTLGGQDGNRVAAFIKSLPAAQHDDGAASAALFLAITTTWRPGGLQFEWQQAHGSGGLGAWAVHITKDSVLEKLFSKFVKSKTVEAAGGAATKVAGEGVKRGVAAILTKLGLSALSGVLTGGTSLLAQAAIWVGGKALGGLWRAGAWLFSARWLTSLLGFGATPSAPKKWYEHDWVPIVIVVAIAILIPMFGAMLQITARDSALFVASFPSNTGGPYIESFPPYYGPFPEESPPLASCPVSSAPITQKPFGDFSHEGVCAYDFGSQKGALVYATHDGCVAALRSDVPNDTFIEGEFGNYVRLAGTSPAGHYYTVYAHLVQGSGLSAGTCVKAGDVVGRVDTTGFTFDSKGRRGGGTHLHYQYNDDQKTCPSLPAGCGY